MARLTEGRPRGVRATPDVLKPYFELWTSNTFQDNFVKSVRADMQNFKDAMWNMDFSNLHPTDHKTWTEILGLPIPQTAEEFQQCFWALKCCISYTQWKLAEVERAALEFQGAAEPGRNPNATR